MDPQQQQAEEERGDIASDVTDAAEPVGRAADGGKTTPETEATLKAELETARAQAAENYERWVRAKAEMENALKRADTSVANAHKYGIERFAAEIVAIKDSLELAQAVDVSPDDPQALNKVREGVALILKLIDDIFTKFSLTTIDPNGERFDPARHHAISTVETDTVPPNHIVKVVQKGYLLHDRVIRPALVIVARAPVPKAGSPDA